MYILIIIFIIAAALLIFFLLRTKRVPEEEYQSVAFETRFRTVTEIVDGDTFKIAPGWKWNNNKGDTIRPTGYDTPERGEEGFEETTEKLSQLILGKEVELGTPIKMSYHRLLVDVFFEGKHLREYFPEYLVLEGDPAARDV